MEPRYDPKQHEEKIYELWEKGGYFTPEINPDGEPYSIIMPPPNANLELHIGHARFVAIEDILIRYARMRGRAALWLPGTDHAGIETQYVFERQLEKEGKSRFDFDRETLYRMIWDYVQKYKGISVKQMKRLGASADWEREKFTLDEDIVEKVYETFYKLVRDGLIYRGERLINYCTHCGTSFSELEVNHIEREDKLYTLDYGAVKIATTRPETIFADIAVAVHPEDKRYKNLVGKKAKIPLIGVEVPIIADERVNPKFGTGAVKITPAHDKQDFEIGQDKSLENIQIIDLAGKLMDHPRVPEKYRGMEVEKAREAVARDLKKAGKLIQTKPLIHNIGVCYRCKNAIEPMLSVQWFLKIRSLADRALEAVRRGETKFAARRFEKIYNHWLENLEDWNISRQIVWGIKIPVWYEVENDRQFYVWFMDKGGKYRQGTLGQLLEEGVSLEEIEEGLVRIFTTPDVKWVLEEDKERGKKYLPEVDTFDTWFSSGQWPYITLQTTEKGDFEKFYPTDVMETGYDILPIWVVRMMILGLYSTGRVPFREIVLHGLVRDEKGEKISKSKGNIINPLKMAEKYGTDALRMALIWGTLIENDIALAEGDIKGQRNFTNKIWNISRFVLTHSPEIKNEKSEIKNKEDEWILKELENSVKSVTLSLERYRLSEAAGEIYDFIWHKFADIYIEKTKARREEAQSTLLYVLQESLKLLHPFMPFVTEAIWQIARAESKKHKAEFFKEEALIVARWPEG